MKKMFSLIVLLSLLITVSCNDNDEVIMPEESTFSLIDYLYKDNNYAARGTEKPQPLIWVDCDDFSGLVVPATFNPVTHSFDELYVMPGHSFKDGLPLISDSKPGDQDYNGGRWHLNILKESVDPAKYMYACTEEDIDPADFMSTNNYFGCPIKPVK